MSLSLPEEVVLLTLDEAGRPVGRQGLAAGLALAGAAVMELALAGRVDTDRHRLLRESAAPTGDAALDLALPLLEQAPDSRGALLLLAREEAALRGAVLAGLEARGILRRAEGRVLLLIPTRRWVKAEDRPEPAEALARLHRALEGEHIPEPREALLEARQSRLAWLAGLEALGRSLGEVVAHLRATRLAR